MRNIVLLVAVISFGASGCSESRRAWSAATDADTIEAYERFVAEYPDAGRTADARTRLQQLKFPLTGAGLPTLERIPDMPYACGGAGDEQKTARGVVYIAREETSLTMEQAQKTFGFATKGRMSNAGKALSGAVRESNGMTYFGDMCFSSSGESGAAVQVTGSFLSDSQGWTLHKGTQITVASDADPAGQTMKQ